MIQLLTFGIEKHVMKYCKYFLIRSVFLLLSFPLQPSRPGYPSPRSSEGFYPGSQHPGHYQVHSSHSVDCNVLGHEFADSDLLFFFFLSIKLKIYKEGFKIAFR